MKKVLFLALAVMASASFTTVNAVVKRVKKNNAAAAPVVLKSSCDSVSYAAGYQMTNGLQQFLLQQGMDTTYTADFIKGLKDANAKKNDPSFTAYSLGLNIASQLNGRMVPGISSQLKEGRDTLNTEMFYNGFYASLNKDTTLYNQKGAETYFNARMKEITDAKAAKKQAEDLKAKKAGEEWLAANAKKDSVITLPSGLQYKVLVQGTGVVPKSDEEVTVNYEGKLINGTIFDSSYKRGEPTKFKPSQVIKGWTEALTMMPVGSTWELYIPESLGYGERQAGQIPPYSTLIFKVEVLDCESAHATVTETPAETPAETTTTTQAKKRKKFLGIF